MNKMLMAGMISFLFFYITDMHAEEFACQELVAKALKEAGVQNENPKRVSLGSTFWNELESRKINLAEIYEHSFEKRVRVDCGGIVECAWEKYQIYYYGEEYLIAAQLGFDIGPPPKTQPEPDQDLLNARRALSDFIKKTNVRQETLDALSSLSNVDEIVSYGKVNAFLSKGRLVAVERVSSNISEEIIAKVAPSQCAYASVKQKYPSRTFTAKLCSNKERAKKILFGRNNFSNASRDKYYSNCIVRGGWVQQSVCKCQDNRVINPMSKSTEQRCNKTDSDLSQGLNAEINKIDLDLTSGFNLSKMKQDELERLKMDIYDACDHYTFASVNIQSDSANKHTAQ